MRSEEPGRRLHPLSIVFGFGAQLRTLALPGIAVLVTAGVTGFLWQAWLMLLLIPYALGSLLHYLRFRYRYEAGEMVIQSGLLFRKVRHVPYRRIQNLDAVQNVFHRLFEVVEVRLETGGGKEPEAILRVVPVAAFEEMRRRVLGARAAAGPAGSVVADTEVDGGAADVALPAADDAARGAPAGEVLLELSPRELLLCGLIENRGWVVLAAVLGFVWQLDLFDTAGEWFVADRSGRDVVRDATGMLEGLGELLLGRVVLALVAAILVLLLLRLISMVWALVRLYGFRLVREGDDLRAEHGLLTRMVTTVPRRRIQTLTLREGPLHRRFERVAVEVETAGGQGSEEHKRRRERLAPILHRRRLTSFLRRVLPGLELDPATVRWRGVHPRAFRRAVKWSILVALGVSIPFFVQLRLWALPVLVLFLGLAVLHTRKRVEHLGWAVVDDAVLMKSGWLWRRVSVVRSARIQAVTVHESPADRRHVMARIRVDVAGAGELSHRVDVPYLPRDVAHRLGDRLATQAAGTAFRW